MLSTRPPLPLLKAKRHTLASPPQNSRQDGEITKCHSNTRAKEMTLCYEKLSKQVLEHSIEQSRMGGHPTVTYLCNNILERFMFM